MLRLRSTIFMVLFYVVFAAFLLVMLPTLVMPRGAIFFMGRSWGRTSLWLYRVLCNVRVEFRGVDNIPRGGGVLIAPKHQSAWDTFAILTLFPDFTFVMKEELLSIPLFGWYMRHAGQVGIDRAKGAAALRDIVARSREVLAEGRPLFIFPEGTRRPAGAPPAYKAGIARVYDECGVPCLPIALNSGLFWPRKNWIRPPGTIVVEFLPPIPAGLDRRVFMRELEASIETATDRLMAEAINRDPTLKSVPTSPLPEDGGRATAL